MKSVLILNGRYSKSGLMTEKENQELIIIKNCAKKLCFLLF